MTLKRIFPANSLTKKELFAISHGQSTKLSSMPEGETFNTLKLAFYTDERQDGSSVDVVALFTDNGTFTTISTATIRTLNEYLDFMYDGQDEFGDDERSILMKLKHGMTRSGREYINVEIL